MNFLIYPVLFLIGLFSIIITPLSYAAEGNPGRGVEVIYPFFYGGKNSEGYGVNTGPCAGPRLWPYSPRIEGRLGVDIKEIEDGVLIKLTSEDEKTIKGLRLMGRMIKLLNDMKELEGEGR